MILIANQERKIKPWEYKLALDMKLHICFKKINIYISLICCWEETF